MSAAAPHALFKKVLTCVPGRLMLLRAYAINMAVTAAAYFAVWAWAPSWPQIIGSFERGVQIYAQDHTVLGPLIYRFIAPRA